MPSIGENKRTGTIISLLGLFLVIIGILSSTIFYDGNLNNRIFGGVVGLAGLASIVLPWPYLWIKIKKEERVGK